MDLSSFRREASVSDNLRDMPESRLQIGSLETKPDRISQTNRTIIYTIVYSVLLVVSLCIGLLTGHALGQDNLQPMNRTIPDGCTDEDIHFMCSNLIPKMNRLKGTRQNQRPMEAGSRQGESSSPGPLGNLVGGKNPYGRDCGRQIMPSAHLYLDYSSLRKDKSKLPWITNTRSSGGTGHISTELIYRSQYGGLEVTQSGVYNVYCQLTFSPTSNVITRFVQCLFRASPSDETQGKPVVCTQTTKMNVTDVEIVQPVRLQAAIKVNIGDILYVNVSEIDYVYLSNNFNYFGIFRIS